MLWSCCENCDRTSSCKGCDDTCCCSTFVSRCSCPPIKPLPITRSLSIWCPLPASSLSSKETFSGKKGFELWPLSSDCCCLSVTLINESVWPRLLLSPLSTTKLKSNSQKNNEKWFLETELEFLEHCSRLKQIIATNNKLWFVPPFIKQQQSCCLSCADSWYLVC